MEVDGCVLQTAAVLFDLSTEVHYEAGGRGGGVGDGPAAWGA